MTSIRAIQRVRDLVAKGALSMIDEANHKPENRGQKPKVGGHQASSMSSVDLLSALYLAVLEPGDRVAVKPHAAPILYAMMHLFGHLDRQAMGSLREYGGPQPYPTETKNPLFVDYTSSSEALGVVATIYDAYGAKHFNRALAGPMGRPEIQATYWAHCGDGELTEGQIDESLYDAGRWGLDNLVWVVDLNRQSLDRVMEDSGQLRRWVRAKFEAQGWQVDELRWGGLAQAIFAREGGAALQQWLEGLDDIYLHPLFLLEAAQLKAFFLGEPGGTEGLEALYTQIRQAAPMGAEVAAEIMRAVADLDAEALKTGLHHLGGHDLEMLIDAYRRAKEADGPVCIIAHTVKGYETSGAAHPENHGGILPEEEVAAWGLDRGLPEGRYPRPADLKAAGDPLADEVAELVQSRAEQLFNPAEHGYEPPPVDVRGALAELRVRARREASTGDAFQSMNVALLRTPLAPYMQFGAPDVGQTTHLGPVIRQTGVFAPKDMPDLYAFMREQQALAFQWRPEADGQFHAFGIAEGNAMMWTYAFGRKKKVLEGKVPLATVVTVYDKFFERAFNQLDYSVYAGARFIAVGVPSGTGLSRETATHQSVQTLRMMMDLPGIVAYEPAFSEDLFAIYAHALTQLWEEDGEAVYLRLTTQPLAQPSSLPENHAEAAVRGAYWLVGEDVRGEADVLLVASGRKLREVRLAAQQLMEEGIGSRILNVTSYEMLWRDWDQFSSDPGAWEDETRSYYLHELFDEQSVNAPLIIVGDHSPSAAEWLPSALMRLRHHRFLGPRGNGEAGDLESVDRHHGMDVASIVQTAKEEMRWRQPLLRSR